MTTEPDQIRRDIERTQENLSADVDALTYKASPKRMARDRVDQVRGGFRSVRSKVMGTASEAGEHTAAATSGIAQQATDMPAKAKRVAEGNPLAAGVVVFGAAWLVSSLLPKTAREQQAAGQVKATAQQHIEPVKETVSSAAGEMKENLREPVQEATESMKSSWETPRRP